MLGVAVRIRSARTPSQTGRGANQPFIPMPVRCDERFVVKARRHQNFEIAEDAEQIEASAGPRIDRPGLQAIVELDLGRLEIRLGPADRKSTRLNSSH